MRAIIKDNKWIYFDNITDYEENILWKEFSVVSPGRDYIDPSQLGMWDGVFRKYNRAKRRMARPFLSMLRGVCDKHELPLEVIDDRASAEYKPLKPEQIDSGLLPSITLDDHQVKSVQAACKIECGIVDVPTGGGKGEIIAGICKAIDCPTVSPFPSSSYYFSFTSTRWNIHNSAFNLTRSLHRLNLIVI